jgi:hypothetical protein
MRIVVGIGDLMQMTGDGRVIERSDGAVCGLYHAHGDEKRGFLSGALKPRSMVCEWFGLKTT